jgi:hypothetical protein
LVNNGQKTFYNTRPQEEDLGSEQHLRKRIEREKHDLQLQIIALSERLTESDASAESQVSAFKK